MKTVLIIGAGLYAILGAVEAVAAIKAKTVEDEMRWRIRELVSLGFVILFSILAKG